MEKSKIRVIYEYEFRRGTTVSETARNINAVFGEGSTTKATVGNWFKNFRDGDFSLANEPRGRPKTKVDNDHLRAVVESDPSQSTRAAATQDSRAVPIRPSTTGPVMTGAMRSSATRLVTMEAAGATQSSATWFSIVDNTTGDHGTGRDCNAAKVG
ncbi:hypothetical protein DMN91_002879 [Ooceraea biroi]|uniref:Mos1 transposase HTH domain-containing protein n=1 Tax=Ooceraea biroi TaxID=2015173 RepID=A0A3L8DXW9_OOCBI|nr:hypothetical protein DMN91_002879 [Ooceraea biroi]